MTEQEERRRKEQERQRREEADRQSAEQQRQLMNTIITSTYDSGSCG